MGTKMAWRVQDFGPRLNAFRDDALLILISDEIRVIDQHWPDCSAMTGVTTHIVMSVLTGEQITIRDIGWAREQTLKLLFKHDLYIDQILTVYKPSIMDEEDADNILFDAKMHPRFKEMKLKLDDDLVLPSETLLRLMKCFSNTAYYLEKYTPEARMHVLENAPLETNLVSSTMVVTAIKMIRRRRIFAISVCVADGYLCPSDNSTAARFLRICGALPLEIQHEICAFTVTPKGTTWVGVEERDLVWALFFERAMVWQYHCFAYGRPRERYCDPAGDHDMRHGGGAAEQGDKKTKARRGTP